MDVTLRPSSKRVLFVEHKPAILQLSVLLLKSLFICPFVRLGEEPGTDREDKVDVRGQGVKLRIELVPKIPEHKE